MAVAFSGTTLAQQHESSASVAEAVAAARTAARALEQYAEYAEGLATLRELLNEVEQTTAAAAAITSGVTTRGIGLRSPSPQALAEEMATQTTGLVNVQRTLAQVQAERVETVNDAAIDSAKPRVDEQKAQMQRTLAILQQALAAQQNAIRAVSQ